MISAAAAVNPGFARLAGGSGPSHSFFDRLSASLRPPQSAALAEPDLLERGYAALRQALQDKLGIAASTTKPATYADTDRPGPRQVADTVLGFVAGRIQREAESGASDERLRDLLAQARAGFEEGLRQASDELAGLGLLDEKMQAGIEETRGLVDAGFDRLQSAFLGSGESSSAVRSQSLFEARQTTSVARSESLNLEVRTRDGDTVRLSFREAAGYRESDYLSYARDRDGSSVSYSSERSAYFSSRFEVSVDGELDADERDALNGLLGKVESLADEFFDGDSQAALQQALSLGYDTEEIAGFSLRMTETSVQQVTEAYRQVQQYGESALPAGGGSRSDLNQGLRNLGQFLKTMREAVDSARAFADGEGLVADLFRIARQLDPRDVAAGDDATLQSRRELLELLGKRFGDPTAPTVDEGGAPGAGQELPLAA